MTLKAPSDPDKSKAGAVTLVLLQANQIVRDPATIGKTMKALDANKSANGLLQDTREALHLPVIPSVALQILQVSPPILILLDKNTDQYALAAKYWQWELLQLVNNNYPNEILSCIVLPKGSDSLLANIYGAVEFAARFHTANTFKQEWDVGLLHDCFQKRPKDPQFGQFLGVSKEAFQDMRVLQNKRKATDPLNG